MLVLDDLLLANLLARKGLAVPSDIQAALEAIDREPGRGDLYGRLAARGGPLAAPGAREKALASVQRYVFAKVEAAFLARLRQSGSVPQPVLEAALAEQKQAGMAWALADKLVRDGKLPPARCQAIQAEAARDLKQQEQQLVAKHRTSRFAETLGISASMVGKATAEFSAALETSSEVLVAAFGAPAAGRATGTLAAAVAPAPSPTHGARHGGADDGASDDGAGEQTIKLPPGAARGAAQAPPAPATATSDDGVGERTMIMPDGGTQQIGVTDPTPRQPPPPGVASAPASAGLLSVGATLAGKYRVVSELGRGGMGVVYRAAAADRDGAEIALKAVPAKGGATNDVLQRFKREILTASLVEHENVCAVYDAGEADGLVYMAMELIEGETLKDLASRDGGLEVERALGLIEQILQGIQACHGVKVIHRDLKPENVRVTKKDGREICKIVDFGIARLVDQDPVIAERVFVTVKGTLSGTPAYVAPELVMEPDLIDPRCDVYAIGIILYELFTGKLPYASKTIRGLLRDTIEARPIPLADAAPGKVFDERVARFLFRLMEKDTEVRYQTAQQALEALAECRKPAPPPEPEKKPGFFARLFGGLFGK